MLKRLIIAVVVVSVIMAVVVIMYPTFSNMGLVDMEVFDQGAIEFIVEVGQRVEAGQPIARISN